MKLDMSLFNENHPDGWVLRAERYFTFNGLAEEEKIEATVVSSEGDTLLLYQWEDRRRPHKVGGDEEFGSLTIPTGAGRFLA